MKLKIIKQNAEIGVKTVPAKLHINSRPPKLNIRQRRAELLIRREDSRLIIDRKEALEQLGSKTLSRVVEDVAKRAINICTEATREIAKEGTRILKAGKSRGEVIKKIIIERMTEEIETTNVDAALKSRPKIKFIKGELNMEWVIHEPEIQWEIHAKVDIEVEPHKVEIYLKKKPFIKIVVEDEDKSEFQPSKIVNRKI